MNIPWHDIILDASSPEKAWQNIFDSLLKLSQVISSPVTLHNETILPDRLLSEAAWNLWHAYPQAAVKTSDKLKTWCQPPDSSGKAILILDALSLRELGPLIAGAKTHGIDPLHIGVTGSQCPSTTGHFAKALGLPSRSALANDGKPGTFTLFDHCHTNTMGIPFEDCPVPPTPNLMIWHSWLDDLIHLQKKAPDQISKIAETTLQGDGFWNFINKLRQGRSLVITADHGYAVSKLFSSSVSDKDAVAVLRKTLGASRNKPADQEWQSRFMPPLVMTHNRQHMVMGQWHWPVQGGLPLVCHGGMSLLEVAVPFVELPPL